MESLVHTTPSVIAKFIMHQLAFNESLMAKERDFAEYGATFFQLKYGLKEMMTREPLLYR
jgi:hypothetical protein